MRHGFRIPIGDWSGDGHGHVQWYSMTSALPLKDVREAYFKSVEHFAEELQPENIAHEYEEANVALVVAKQIEEISGIKIGHEEDSDQVYVDMDGLLEYLVWFINHGNPLVDVKLEERDDMFPFFGYDEKKRHIGFIGYGLLGN